MMKSKLSLATTISTVLLFTMLTSVKIPFLIFTAFILLIARGVKMYLDFTNEEYTLNENQPEENFGKLLLLRIFMQLIPIAFVALCFFILLLRKEVWLKSINFI